MLSWFIREIKTLSDAVDNYFFGPSQAVLAEQRRVRELRQIETLLDSRKEIKAMHTVKRQLDLTVSYTKLREFVAATKKFSKEIDELGTKRFKTKRIKNNRQNLIRRVFDKAWHNLYIDEKRLIAAIFYNVQFDDGILYHEFYEEEYTWDLFEDRVNDFYAIRSILRIHQLWRADLDQEISIYHKRKRAAANTA